MAENIVKKFLRFIGFTDKAISQEDLFERDTTREQEMFLYKTIVSGDSSDMDKVFRSFFGGKFYFWGSDTDYNHPIQKKTLGFAKEVVGLYVNLFSQRFSGIEIMDKTANDIFDKIAKKNDLDNLILQMVNMCGVTGGGAIKYNPPIHGNNLPVIEFVDNQFITKEYDKNELKSISFYYFYSYNHKKYRLIEIRSKGKIEYELYEGEKPAALTDIPQTAGLSNIYFYYLDENGEVLIDENGNPKMSDFILATDVQLGQSGKWEHFGESLIEGKVDNYDSLDQLESFNNQTIVNAWPQKVIPDDTLYRQKDGHTNIIRTLYNSYIRKPVINTENLDTSVSIVQGQLQAQDYQVLLSAKKENCVTGKASMNSLGANAQHYNSEDDQREREKVTMYQYNKYKALFEVVLTDLVEKSIILYNWLNPTEKDIIVDPAEIIVKIGDFINPSFEAAVETVVKGATVLPIEDQVDILWKNGITSKEREEKIRALYIINYGVESLDELLQSKKDNKELMQENAIQQKSENTDEKAVQENKDQKDDKKAIQK